MPDKVSLETLKKWIPDLTSFGAKENKEIIEKVSVAVMADHGGPAKCQWSNAQLRAKRHCLLHGRGVPLHSMAPRTRIAISTDKIENFIGFITSPHIIQDIQFGEKTIKLSTEDLVRVPNVVCMIIPERIVQQYQAYCQESGFESLSRSTRMLNVCSTSVRKSLQGLDYIRSSGFQAFDDLHNVAEKLGYSGKGLAWAKCQQDRLKSAKRYLKSDYKVDVSQDSTVADHCRSYALSDLKDRDFQSSCSHDHRDICERCDLPTSTLKKIEDGLRDQSDQSES
ncbi:hypothetical protein QZH41_008149 [Actinostola sp. cb2023]|nr:hypothetical protein QZH41_008149 [Actinostola sp. cb2023]